MFAAGLRIYHTWKLEKNRDTSVALLIA